MKIEAIREYEDRGYTIVRSVLSVDQIEAVRAQFSVLLDRPYRTVSGDEIGEKTPEEKFRYLEKHAPRLKSHCFDLLPRCDTVHRVAASPIVQQTAEALGYSPYLIDDLTVVACTNANDRKQDLHQDLGHLSERMLSIWIPLIPITPENGGLLVCPGSHKLGRLRHRECYDEFGHRQHIVSDLRLTQNSAEFVEINAGDMLAFNGHLVHGSADMTNDVVRWTIIARINHLLDVPYLMSETAPMRIPQHISPDE
jgi:ectoine hydroxylase-related dioxygenase (phytanoyl-CoA dioxygenase family)